MKDANREEAVKLDLKFIIAPDSPAFVGSHFVQLRHPKHGGAALFHVGADGELSEVLRLGEQCASWFCADAVVEDGALLICSPTHPAFLALRYLLASRKVFVPLDQLLEDADFPLISELVDSSRLRKWLELYSDSKTVGDARVFRYSEEKTLDWLKMKLLKLTACLREAESVPSALLNNDDALLFYSWGILADYLPLAVSESLKSHANVKQPVLDNLTPATTTNKRKVGEVEPPLESYYDENAKVAKTPAVILSQTQKKLQKASVGTKALSSFFKKTS